MKRSPDQRYHIMVPGESGTLGADGIPSGVSYDEEDEAQEHVALYGGWVRDTQEGRVWTRETGWQDA